MMDFTEKELCVLCERGGKLLVCNDIGCPISVHEDCMGCSPRFNENGNFCCPYCVYRRLTTETCQLRDKAMLAKKALSSFLGENIAQNQSKSSSSPCESKHETSVSEESDRTPNRKGEFSGVCDFDGSTCRIMVVYDGDACKEQGKHAKGVPVEDEAGSSEKRSTGWNAKPPLLKGKRKRWSEEEEDMLKEGVEKFSSTANKNFPWKKVLEFGRHVFHTSRTPSDLKDKWRNMSK